MKLKIKKLHPDAVIPKYAKPGDAGLDLVATDDGTYITDLDCHEYGTGLAFEIPEGHVGLIFPRSSISKTPQMLTNSVGVIDAGYRGEVKARFRCVTQGMPLYKKGDRIVQLLVIPFPKMEIEESDALSDTSRGSGGFGSTGN